MRQKKAFTMIKINFNLTNSLKEQRVVYFQTMSDSCHFDRVLNVEIGVECQIFVIAIFFKRSRVLQFGAH